MKVRNLFKRGPKFAAVLALAAMASVAACGSSSGSGATSAGSTSAQSSASGDTTSSASSTSDAPQQTGDSSGEAVVLDFPNFQNIEKPYATWWEAFLADYRAKYPNVTVNVSSVSNSAALQELATTRFAAGNPPDILHAATGSFASFANAGYLMPLDDILADTNVPKSWGDLQSSFVWEGKTLGVMSLSSALVLHYNKKLLDDAGAKVPTTPDELIAAAKAVTNPAKGVYGFAGSTTGTDTTLQNQGGAFVYGMGGSWFNECKPNVTSPETKEALRVYRAVMETSPKGMQGSQAKTLFGAGKAAFLIEKPSYASTIIANASDNMKNDFAATRLPFAHTAGNANVYLALPSGLTGAKLDAAVNFIKLAASPEWQKKYAEIIGAPAPDSNATADLSASNPQMALFSELTAEAVNIIPTCPAVAVKYPVIQREIYDTLTNVATTDADLGTLLEGLEQSISKNLG